MVPYQLMYRSIRKGSFSRPLSQVIRPESFVDGIIWVGPHFTSDHLAFSVFAFKDAAVGEPHDTFIMHVIILEATLVEVTISIGKTISSDPSTMDPVYVVPPAFLFALQVTPSIEHASTRPQNEEWRKNPVDTHNKF